MGTEKSALIGKKPIEDNNMYFEPMKIVVSETYDEVADFLEMMDDDSKYLPLGALDQIEPFSNLAFLLIGNYEQREDLQDILTFAFENDYRVFYLEFTEVINKRLH